MRILLLNDSYFLDCLRESPDNDVFFVSPAEGADYVVGFGAIDIHQALEKCPFEPDAILISDSINLRTAVLGLENISIPKLFYGIDSPMNAFWQQDYSLAVDLAFLDQKSMADRLRMKHPKIKDRFHWLPLAADTAYCRNLGLDKIYDISFVGTLSNKVRPKRTWILNELSRQFKVKIFDGDGQKNLTPGQVVEIYNKSKIVLNENLFPGLNLRAFEVMACGACLLTEEGDGSWSSFFKDWEHLVTYNPANLIDRTEKLLNDDPLRAQIAEQGMLCVNEKHTIKNRLNYLLEVVKKRILNSQNPNMADNSAFYLGKAVLQMANRWQNQPVGQLRGEAVRLMLLQADNGSESAELHSELAAHALEDDRPQDALKSLHRTLELDPAHLRANWSMIWCHRELKKLPEASDALNKFCQYIRFDVDKDDALQSIASGLPLSAADFIMLGRILESAGWLLEPGIDRAGGHSCRWNAFDAYQHAIITDNQNWQAYIKCAEMLDRFGSHDFAAILVEQALRLNSWDTDLSLKLGDYLLKSFRREEGIIHLVNYLVTTNDFDKWDKIENIKLSEAEWLYLLSKVQDSCGNIGDTMKSSDPISETCRRVLKRLSGMNMHQKATREVRA